MTIGKTRGRPSQRDVLRDLGATVRAYRRERHWTREDLARSIHFSIAYVILIERGRRNPPYTTVVAIARALGVSAGALFAEGAAGGSHARRRRRRGQLSPTGG